MRGITDANGDVLTGKDRRLVVKDLTEELKRDARAAAGHEASAAGPGRDRTAQLGVPPGLGPPGTFSVPTSRDEARPAPWGNQRGGDELYGRQQRYGGT